MRVAIDIRRAGDFGVGTYIRNIVNQIARQDTETRFLLIGGPEHREQLDPLPSNFELLSFRAAPGSFRSHFLLPLLLQQRRVDLYHVPWLHTPVLKPSRMVITVHDLTDLLPPLAPASPPAQHARLYAARRMLARADRVLAVSQTTAHELVRIFRVPESRIEVIYNALDERFVREPVPATADRVLERHAVTDPYVLYAGNVKPQKNLPRLIEAFAVAKGELRNDPRFAHLKLLLIGDALTRHPDLRRAVVRARVREDIRFLGFVPYRVLRVFYARALAFLFPSLYEGFGLPPLEAMAHGTPVLTSDVSSLPEIFGDAALLVNPENVFDIARGIRRILTEDALRETLIARGYELLRRYSWEQSARQVLQAYRDVLSGREVEPAAAKAASPGQTL